MPHMAEEAKLHSPGNHRVEDSQSNQDPNFGVEGDSIGYLLDDCGGLIHVILFLSSAQKSFRRPY